MSNKMNVSISVSIADIAYKMCQDPEFAYELLDEFAWQINSNPLGELTKKLYEDGTSHHLQELIEKMYDAVHRLKEEE